jgi:hypothetical protein
VAAQQGSLRGDGMNNSEQGSAHRVADEGICDSEHIPVLGRSKVWLQQRNSIAFGLGQFLCLCELDTTFLCRNIFSKYFVTSAEQRTTAISSGTKYRTRIKQKQSTKNMQLLTFYHRRRHPQSIRPSTRPPSFTN